MKRFLFFAVFRWGSRAIPGLGRTPWDGSLNATMLLRGWVERAEPESGAFGRLRLRSALVDMPIDTVYMSMDMPLGRSGGLTGRAGWGGGGMSARGEGPWTRDRDGHMAPESEWGSLISPTLPVCSRNWCLISTAHAPISHNIHASLLTLAKKDQKSFGKATRLTIFGFFFCLAVRLVWPRSGSPPWQSVILILVYLKSHI